MQRQTVTVTEFAEIIGISRNAGYQAAARGDVRSVRLGHRILIPSSEIRRLLDPSPTPKGTTVVIEPVDDNTGSKRSEGNCR